MKGWQQNGSGVSVFRSVAKSSDERKQERMQIMYSPQPYQQKENKRLLYMPTCIGIFYTYKSEYWYQLQLKLYKFDT